MKTLLFLLTLCFNLNFAFSQQANNDCDKEKSDTTIFRYTKKNMISGALYNAAKEGNYDHLLMFLNPNIFLSFSRDTMVIQTHEVSNYQTLSFLNKLSDITPYSMFKIIDSAKYNELDVIVVQLLKNEDKKGVLINVFFILNSENFITDIVIENPN
jgi:hypothetical protein